MWVYRETERGNWTVGFYSPDGEWCPDSDHFSSEKAAERVHYLNGGQTAVLSTDTLERHRRAYEASRGRAVCLLSHYLRQGVEASGTFWGADNVAEVEKMVDQLIEAAANADGEPEEGTVGKRTG